MNTKSFTSHYPSCHTSVKVVFMFHVNGWDELDNAQVTFNDINSDNQESSIHFNFSDGRLMVVDVEESNTDYSETQNVYEVVYTLKDLKQKTSCKLSLRLEKGKSGSSITAGFTCPTSGAVQLAGNSMAYFKGGETDQFIVIGKD